MGRENHLGQSRVKLTVLRPIRGDQGVRNDEEDSMEVMGWADMPRGGRARKKGRDVEISPNPLVGPPSPPPPA